MLYQLSHIRAAGLWKVSRNRFLLPSGEALFEVSRGTVAGFLQLTASVVPFGEESSVLEVDGELAALLSNGGADPTGR